MEETAVKAIFFVDTVYLMRLKQQAAEIPVCADDFKKVSGQLQTLIRKGHYVFPHIHPHWLDAVYLEDTNQWQLNNIFKYRFSNISRDEQRLVFKGSYDVLQEIISEVSPDYIIDTHRAGGWSVQPFSNFCTYFEEFGFKYDFSVLDKYYMFTGAQFFDYSAIPDKNIYRFDSDVTIEVPDGKYIEFVNSTIRVRPLIKIFDHLLLKLIYKVSNDITYGSGRGQSARRINTAQPVSDQGFDMTNVKNQYIAVEQMSFLKLSSYLNYMKNHNYMHFVSHPKMVTEHNLRTFLKFLKKITKLYSIESDFKKMFFCYFSVLVC